MAASHQEPSKRTTVGGVDMLDNPHCVRHKEFVRNCFRCELELLLVESRWTRGDDGVLRNAESPGGLVPTRTENVENDF